MTAETGTPLSAAEALRRAIASYEAGALDEATPLLQAILRAVPDQFESLHLLGVIRARQGDHEDAAALLGRAVAANPDSVQAHDNHGQVLMRLRRFEAAASSFARVVALAPDHVEAHYHAALALMRLERPAPAADSLRQAIALKPDFAAAHGALGTVLNRMRRLDEAVACFRRALELSPDDGRVCSNLGATLHELGRSDEAEAALRRAIAINPDHADAHRNLGLALGRLRRFEAAVASLRRAVTLTPDSAETHHALGVALANLGHPHDAVASHRTALALKPDFAEAHYSLATALREFRQFEAALESCRRALQLRPQLPGALSVALQLSQTMCDWKALGAAADAALAAAGRIVMSPFPLLSVTDDAAVLHSIATHFSAERIRGAPLPPVQDARPAHERIRLAYLSADFHEHAVARLAAGLFERHDRSQFEIHALSLGPDDASPMRRRLHRAFDAFIDARSLSDREVASEIRRREIDILIDLGGHTSGNRPGIAALRAAPIQVSYLGYAGTMGAPFIDYVLVDRFVVPPGQQSFFSEQLVHLPESYQVNDRDRAIDAQAPLRDECGLPGSDFVFCCFNNPYKVTPAMFDIWMRLLRAVPGSTLWLLDSNRWATENLRREALARGVDCERLVFAPHVPLAAHLARHRLADLFLDTLPYNAHTTASDALWAGLPVLTCAGHSFAARVAGSLLNATGLPELVTHSLADYEALALRLAAEPAMLRDIGARLAANRPRVPLFDTDRSRRHIEAAYRQMWSIWQHGEPPRAFAVEPI